MPYNENNTHIKLGCFADALIGYASALYQCKPQVDEGEAFSDCLVATPKLGCKSHEGRQSMPTTESCPWRQVYRAFRFQKRSVFREKNKYTKLDLRGRFCPSHPSGVGLRGTKGEDGFHRRSWPSTLAPDGISAGSTQKQLSSKNTEVFWTCSLAGG